jgi:hypothetical protein
MTRFRPKLILPALLVLMAQGGSPDTTILNPPTMSTNPGAVAPAMRIPPYVPAPTPLPPATGSVAAPAAAAPFQPAQLPNVGPNTGYGTGGLQQAPGSPPNPPYPAGGALH